MSDEYISLKELKESTGAIREIVVPYLEKAGIEIHRCHKRKGLYIAAKDAEKAREAIRLRGEFAVNIDGTLEQQRVEITAEGMEEDCGAGRTPFGLVRVGNITKAVGYNLGNGTAVLRDAGIEIVKNPATGTPCVRLQDKDAASELLASLVPPAGAVAIEADRVEISPEGPAVDYEALKEQEAEVAVRGILAQFEDEALVAELRRRGWAVSCTKSI